MNHEVQCPECGSMRNPNLRVPCPLCGAQIKTFLGFRVSGYKNKEMNSISDHTDIALWGPSASGKSWFLHALSKELDWYNRVDPNFEYRLYDYKDSPVRDYSLPNNEILPTAFAEDYAWRFERRGKKNTLPHKISSHLHNIVVHDSPGRTMIDAVVNNSKYENEMYNNILRYSNNIIVFLDPTNINDNPISETANNSFLNTTKHDYERLLYELIKISLEEKKYLRLAICLSKSDLISNCLPAEELVSTIFGQDLINIIKSRQVISSFFRISSVGIVNITAEGNLREVENWNPINVVSPFFWIFESVERERITTGDSFFDDRERYYLPYPPPRLIYPE